MSITEQLLYQTDNSSHWRCSIKNAPHKIFCNIHSKTPVLKSLLGKSWNKVAGRKVCNFIKKRFQHRCFSENIAKFLITTVLKNIPVWLRLKIMIKKRFLGKVTSHNYHYMINMGSQRPNIGNNWLLTGPYLQRWLI